MRRNGKDRDAPAAGNQHTLGKPMDCMGIGLHSGARVTMRLHPAEANAGILFRRTDVAAGTGDILARWDNVVDTRMCSMIGNEHGVTIGTVEHLMSALSGCGVDNAVVELDGPEVPVMDGSAQPFVFLIGCAGLVEQQAPRRVIEILKPVRVERGEAVAELLPDDSYSFGFEIDFDSEAVARQQIYVALINGTYKREIARARTFGFLKEVESLRAAGLALGGSLDNAVVVDGSEILNEGGLRFEDEFVRHKVLDAVGDLYLAGGVVRGHYHGVRSGHGLTNELLRALFADESAFRVLGADDAAASSAPALQEAEPVRLVAIA